MGKRPLKIISIFLCCLLIVQQTGFAQVASVELNIAGQFTSLRNTLFPDKFRPLHLRYISYDGLKNNFKLLLDKGDIKNPKTQDIESTTKDLLNYFSVGIALPNDTFWVNLRPDSPNDIIDPLLAQTDVGRIFLEADLQLKKDTANATNPGTPEGKEYWDKLYQKAGEIYGTQNVTIPTLTRPWIVPGEIIIRESADSAYVYKATLKVMLEQDYLKGNATYSFKDEREKQLNEYSSQIIREDIIPKLTKEINNAKRYAPLRQVYYSLILAQWFKARNQNKNTQKAKLIDRKDLSNLQAKVAYSVDTYFNAYKDNFAKGEYSLKEPISTPNGQVIRSYFSGGIIVPSLIRPLGTPLEQNTAVISPASIIPAASSNLPVGNGNNIEAETNGDLVHVWLKTQNPPQAYMSRFARAPGESEEDFIARLHNSKYEVRVVIVSSVAELQKLARQAGFKGDVGNGFGYNNNGQAEVYVLRGHETDSVLMTHEVSEALARQNIGGVAAAGAETGEVGTASDLVNPLFHLTGDDLIKAWDYLIAHGGADSASSLASAISLNRLSGDNLTKAWDFIIAHGDAKAASSLASVIYFNPLSEADLTKALDFMITHGDADTASSLAFAIYKNRLSGDSLTKALDFIITHGDATAAYRLSNALDRLSGDSLTKALDFIVTHGDAGVALNLANAIDSLSGDNRTKALDFIITHGDADAAFKLSNVIYFNHLSGADLTKAVDFIIAHGNAYAARDLASAISQNHLSGANLTKAWGFITEKGNPEAIIRIQEYADAQGLDIRTVEPAFGICTLLSYLPKDQWLTAVRRRTLLVPAVQTLLAASNNSSLPSTQLIGKIRAEIESQNKRFNGFQTKLVNGYQPQTEEDFMMLDIFLASIDDDYIASFTELAEQFGVPNWRSLPRWKILEIVSHQLTTIPLVSGTATFPLTIQESIFAIPETLLPQVQAFFRYCLAQSNTPQVDPVAMLEDIGKIFSPATIRLLLDPQTKAETMQRLLPYLRTEGQEVLLRKIDGIIASNLSDEQKLVNLTNVLAGALSIGASILNAVWRQLFTLSNLDPLISQFVNGTLSVSEMNLLVKRLGELVNQHLADYFLAHPQLAYLQKTLEATDGLKLIKQVNARIIETVQQQEKYTKTISLVFTSRTLLDVWQGVISGTCFGDRPAHLSKRANIIPVKMVKDGEVFGNALFLIQPGRFILIGFDPAESFASVVTSEKMHEFIDRSMETFIQIADANNWEFMIGASGEVGGLSNREGVGDYIKTRYLQQSTAVSITPEAKLHPTHGYEPKHAQKLNPSVLTTLQRSSNKPVFQIQADLVHVWLKTQNPPQAYMSRFARAPGESEEDFIARLHNSKYEVRVVIVSSVAELQKLARQAGFKGDVGNGFGYNNNGRAEVYVLRGHETDSVLMTHEVSEALARQNIGGVAAAGAETGEVGNNGTLGGRGKGSGSESVFERLIKGARDKFASLSAHKNNNAPVAGPVLTLAQRLAAEEEITVGELVSLQTNLSREVSLAYAFEQEYINGLKMLTGYWNHNIANFISRQFADQERGVVELISNGLDASREDENVKVRLRTGELIVANSGPGIALDKIFTCLLIPTYSTKSLQDEKIGRFGVGFLSSLNYLNGDSDTMEIVSFTDGVGFRIRFRVRIEGEGKQKKKIIIVQSIEENINLNSEERANLFPGFTNQGSLSGTSIRIISQELNVEENAAIRDAMFKRFSYWPGAKVVLVEDSENNAEVVTTIGLDRNFYRDAYVKQEGKAGKSFRVIFKTSQNNSQRLANTTQAPGSGKLVITLQGVVLYTIAIPGSNAAEELVVNLPASTKIPTSRDRVIIDKQTIDGIFEAARQVSADANLTLSEKIAILNSLYYFFDWAANTNPSLVAGKNEDFKKIIQEIIAAERVRLENSSETTLFIPDTLQAKEFFEQTEGIILVNPKLLSEISILGSQPRQFSESIEPLRQSKLRIFIISTKNARPVVRLGNTVFVKESGNIDNTDTIWQYILAATAINYWIFMKNQLGQLGDARFESASQYSEDVNEDLARKEMVFGYIRQRIEQLKSEIIKGKEDLEASQNLHTSVDQAVSLKLEQALRALETFNHLLALVENSKTGSGFFFIFKKQIENSGIDLGFASQRTVGKDNFSKFGPAEWDRYFKSSIFDTMVASTTTIERPNRVTESTQPDGVFQADLILKIMGSTRGKARSVDIAQELTFEEKNLVFVVDIISQWMQEGGNVHRERIEKLLNDLEQEKALQELFEIITDYRIHYADNKTIDARQVAALLQFLDYRFIHQQEVSANLETTVGSMPAPSGGRLISAGRLVDVVASFFRLGRDISSTEEVIQEGSEGEGLRFRAAQGQIQQSINYQDPEEFVFIRELLQNARDAILEYEASGKTLKDKKRRVDLRIRLVRDGEQLKSEVVVSDPVGMDLGRVLNFLLIPNRSSKVVEFLTGFFGHGFFTALKESEEVRVKTSTGDGRIFIIILTPVLDAQEGVITDVKYEIYEEKGNFQGTEVTWRKRGETSLIDNGLLKAKAEMFSRTMQEDIPVYLNNADKPVVTIDRGRAQLAVFQTSSGARCAVYFDPGQPSLVVQKGLFVAHFDRHFLEDVLGISPTSDLFNLLLRLADAGVVVELSEEINLTRDRAHFIKKDFTPEMKDIVMSALFDAAIKALLAGKIILPYDFGYDFLTEIRSEPLSQENNSPFLRIAMMGYDADLQPMLRILNDKLLNAAKNWYVQGRLSLQDLLSGFKNKVANYQKATKDAIVEFLTSPECRVFIEAAASGKITFKHRQDLLAKFDAIMLQFPGQSLIIGGIRRQLEIAVASFKKAGAVNPDQIMGELKVIFNQAAQDIYEDLVHEAISSAIRGTLGGFRHVTNKYEMVVQKTAIKLNLISFKSPKEQPVEEQPIASSFVYPEIEEAIINNLTSKFLSNNLLTLSDFWQVIGIAVNEFKDNQAQGRDEHLDLKKAVDDLAVRSNIGLTGITLQKVSPYKLKLPNLYFFLKATQILIDNFRQARARLDGNNQAYSGPIEASAYYDAEDTHVLARGGLGGIHWQLGTCLFLVNALTQYIKDPSDANFSGFLSQLIETISHEMTHVEEGSLNTEKREGTHNKAFFDLQLKLLGAALQDAEFQRVLKQSLQELAVEYQNDFSGDSQKIMENFLKRDSDIAAIDQIGRVLSESAGLVKIATGQTNPQQDFREGLRRQAEQDQVLGRPITEDELNAIVEAHLVGEGQGHFLGRQNSDGTYEKNEDPNKAYTPEEIAQKARILKKAKFTNEQIKKLMKFGITGNKDPGKRGNWAKASLVNTLRKKSPSYFVDQTRGMDTKTVLVNLPRILVQFMALFFYDLSYKSTLGSLKKVLQKKGSEDYYSSMQDYCDSLRSAPTVAAFRDALSAAKKLLFLVNMASTEHDRLSFWDKNISNTSQTNVLNVLGLINKYIPTHWFNKITANKKQRLIKTLFFDTYYLQDHALDILQNESIFADTFRLVSRGGYEYINVINKIFGVGYQMAGKMPLYISQLNSLMTIFKQESIPPQFASNSLAFTDLEKHPEYLLTLIDNAHALGQLMRTIRTWRLKGKSIIHGYNFSTLISELLSSRAVTPERIANILSLLPRIESTIYRFIPQDTRETYWQNALLYIWLSEHPEKSIEQLRSLSDERILEILKILEEAVGVPLEKKHVILDILINTDDYSTAKSFIVSLFYSYQWEGDYSYDRQFYQESLFAQPDKARAFLHVTPAHLERLRGLMVKLRMDKGNVETTRFQNWSNFKNIVDLLFRAQDPSAVLDVLERYPANTAQFSVDYALRNKQDPADSLSSFFLLLEMPAELTQLPQKKQASIMQWIMMTNWQQETPENILRLFHERARSIKPILLASDADAISNLLDRLFITGGKGSFVGQVRNESINMLFRTQLHSLPEFLIKRLNQSLLREDVPELAEMIGYYHKYDYEYRFEDWTNKLSADEIRALIKQYVALLLPHANKDTLEFFTRYALNNPEHLLSIYANRRNIDRNITKFSSLMAYMYQYGQVMRDEFLTWLMPQDISIDNEKISISADGLYKIFQITPFTLYELKELLGLVPLDQKASFLYKRIAELMAIEIRNVGIGNNSNVLLDFGDYIIPYLPEDQQPFVRAYIQVNNSLGWRLTQSGGLTYYQQSLAGKSPNEMIATVVQDEMRNGRMLNIDVILLDYLSDEVLALLLPEQKAFLATYKAVPKLQWRFKQPDGFTYYQQSLAGKSPIEMIATVVQDETIKGAIIGNVMSLVQDQAVTNLLPVQVRNFWLAYQHPSITTEEQRRFLALHREQIDKYYQNNEITAMFYKDFAAQDPHGFVRSSDKKAWMVVFGEERIKRLLEVLPTGLADEKRNAFTHNEYDRTSLFFSYATEQLKDNFSLNEQDLDLMIQYIAKFGLSKTISLFYYFKHLTLLEQKRISALPADIQATGITSIAELERRVIAIQEKAFGEQQLMQISELAPFEQEILSLITMHSVHRWTVIPISQLAQNFDQDMQAGAIALLQPEYLPHTISVPLVVVTSDLSTTGECYEGFRREILASLNAPEQISEIRDRIKQIFIWKLEDLRKSADPSKPAFRFIQTQIGQIEPKISLIEQATTIDQLIGILIQEKLSYFGEKDKDLTSLVRELVFRKLFIKHERSEGWREEIRNLLENPISVQSISEVINIVDNYIKDHVLNVQTENADGYWDADTFALLKQYKKKNNLNDLFLSQLNELRTVMANMQIQEQRENLSIELIPDRGLIGEMAGYLGGVCYTKVFPLLKQYPNVTPYKFVARDPQTGEKRLLGSALVFETTDTDGNPVMVIRAFDVRYETSMDIGKFFERFVDALQEVAAKRGIKKILAAGTGGTISNYPMIINYVLSNYVTGKPATTLQNTFNFNTYDITDKVYLVRSLMPAAQSETSSAQAGTTTANNQAANQGFEGGVVQDAQAFEQAWNDNNREQVVISPEHLAVLQGPAMGPTFRTPEVKLVSEVEMAAITGDKYVHVARIENRVLVVTDYWNSLSAGVKLDLLMHEGMEDWMEKNRSTMPAQDIAMALEGFRINEAERRARHLGVSQGDQSVSSVETGVAEDPVEVQGMILNLLAQSNVAQYLSDEVVSRSNGEVGGVLYYQKITYDAEHLIRIAKRSGLTYEALRQILATQLLEACKKYSEKSITKLQLQVIMNRICNKIEVEQHQAPGALDESSLPSQPYTNAVAREVIEPVLTKGEEEVQLRILDVGSGSGIVSVAAASVDRSSHVVGLDPDPGNVRLANRVKQFAGNLDRAGLFDRSGDVETRVEELESSKEVPEPVDNVEFQVGSATQILFGDDSFNRIIYFDVDAFIFSKDDKVKAIQEILRVIDKKKGGVIHARPKASATEKDVQNFIEVFNIEASKLGLKLDHQLTYSTESGRSVLFIIQPSRVPDSRKSERPIAGSPTEAGAREKQRNKEQIKNNIRWPWQRMSLERKIREVYSAQALEAVKKNGGNIIGVGFIGDGFASVTVIRTVSSSGEIKSFALQTRFIGEGRNSAINNQEAFYQLTPENVPRVYYKVQRGGAVGSLGARGVIEVTVTDAIEGDNLWNEMSTLYTGGTSNISREDLRGILYQAGKAVATWHKNKFFHGDFGLGHIRLRGKTPVVIDYDLADTSRQTGYVYADTAALFSHLEMFASFASQEEIRVLKNNFLRGYREVYLDSDREEGIFDREINLVAIIQKSPAMSAEVMPQIFAQGQKLEELLEGRNNIFKRDSIPARLVLNIDGTVKLELISSAASSQTPRTPGDIHTSGSLAGKKADTQQREGGIDSSASLPSASAQSNMGGIDFRFLPIVTQSLDNLKASIRKIPVGSLQRIDLSQEWSDIERLVNAGIIPSAERLKGYLFASCCKGNYDNDAGKMVYCIAEVLRMEEESCSATDPALKDILVVLGSGRSAEELKLAFAN